MNTSVGRIKIADRPFLCFLIIISLSMACSSTGRQLPIVVSEPGQEKVDIDLVLSNVQKEVQKKLPDAYLVFFSFVGKCTALPKLQGEIHTDFAQVKHSLFDNRTFFAQATVYTFNQTLSLDVKDETEHYADIGPLVLSGKSVQEIASLLYEYLSSMNRCKDTIVLTRVRTESPWRVRCGPPDEVFLECIEIDPLTGEITELR